jgi:hypothetical protein
VYLQNQVQNELKFQRRNEELPEAAGARGSRTRSSGTRSSDQDWNILKEVRDVNERLTSASPAPPYPQLVQSGQGRGKMKMSGGDRLLGSRDNVKKVRCRQNLPKFLKKIFGKV